MLSESRRPPIVTPQRLPFDEVPPRVRTAAVVPVVDEVPELLAAAERVLTACAEVEREHGERCLATAPALDPALTPPLAVAGPELPRPLADRVALRALRRLALALHPRVPGDAEGWWAPGGHDRVIEYRAVVVDARDLPLLAEAAAALVHPRRAHAAALARVRERLGVDVGEPPADRHPEALGCLLATILPVDDAETVVVHRVAREARAGSTGAVVLDERALAAHRALGRRILRRL